MRERKGERRGVWGFENADEGGMGRWETVYINWYKCNIMYMLRRVDLDSKVFKNV